MRPFSRFGELLFYAAATAVLAALVHSTLVLAIPAVADHDAFSTVAALAPNGETETLPRAAPAARRFPYLDPAVAAAFCRYDLAAGPVRVRAPLGRAGFMSISFHSREGAVFFALTDRAATHGRLEAVVVTPAQLRALIAADDEDNPSQDLRIVSPTDQGFVLMRVFSEEPSLYSDAEAQAKTLQCASEAAKD